MEGAVHSSVLRPELRPTLERVHSLSLEYAHIYFCHEESEAQKYAVVIWDCSCEPFGRFGREIKPLGVFQKRNGSFLSEKLTFLQMERDRQWFQVRLP